MRRENETRSEPQQGSDGEPGTPDRLYREAFERSAAGEAMVAPDGRCLHVNGALCELSGYAADELVGMPVVELAAPEWREATERLRQSLLAGERDSVSDEALLLRKDGSTRWVRVVVSLSRDEGGSPQHFFAQLVDVTRRRESEEHLARSQRIARIGSWEWDVASDTTTWSDELYRMYGLDPRSHDATSRGFLAVVHEDDRVRMTKAVSAVLSGEQDGYRLVVRIVRPDGTAVPVEVTGEALRDGSGRLLRIAGVDRDVTDELEAADELAGLRSELAHAHRLEAIGRLAGGVAHEINNALTAIGGYTELVLSGLDASHPARRDAEALRRVADDAAALPRQLLAFARRQSLRPQEVDVAATVADGEALLRHLLAPGIALHLAGTSSGVRARVDPGQLQLVLVNLVLNARDAMGEAGTVTIEVGRRELDEDDASALEVARGSYARLAVVDTGSGMDEETRRRAMEPFFTTKPDGEGTGLGLATVFGVVRQSGGTVTVDSRPGAGTRVEVLLPAVSAPSPGSADVPAPADTVALVVEDQPAVRRVAERALASAGYRVVAASSGDEALALAREREVDLLVTDVRLGGGRTGVDVARALREAAPSLAVVLVSGYTDVDIEPGDHVFLPKPFSPADLAAAASAALARRPAPSSTR